MSDDTKAPTPPPAPKTKPPATQPKGVAVVISKEEWAAIHSEKPESVYDLRPRAWRPSQNVTRLVDTACPHCGARVQEMTGPTELRCMGCGATPAKD